MAATPHAAALANKTLKPGQKPTTAAGQAHLATLLQAYHANRPATLQSSILSPSGITALAQQIATEQTQPTIDAAKAGISTAQGMDKYQSGELAGAYGQANDYFKTALANQTANQATGAANLKAIGDNAQTAIATQGQTETAAAQAAQAQRGVSDPNAIQQITDRYAQAGAQAAGRAQTSQTLGTQLGQVGQNFLSGLGGVTQAAQPGALQQLHNRFAGTIATNQAAITSAEQNKGNIVADTTEKLNQTNFTNLATMATLGNAQAKTQLDKYLGDQSNATRLLGIQSAANTAQADRTSRETIAANNLDEKTRHDTTVEGLTQQRIAQAGKKGKGKSAYNASAGARQTFTQRYTAGVTDANTLTGAIKNGQLTIDDAITILAHGTNGHVQQQPVYATASDGSAVTDAQGNPVQAKDAKGSAIFKNATVGKSQGIGDPVVARAALETALYGGISHSTAVKLHAGGFSVKTLGLKTISDARIKLDDLRRGANQVLP